MMRHTVILRVCSMWLKITHSSGKWQFSSVSLLEFVDRVTTLISLSPFTSPLEPQFQFYVTEHDILSSTKVIWAPFLHQQGIYRLLGSNRNVSVCLLVTGRVQGDCNRAFLTWSPQIYVLHLLAPDLEFVESQSFFICKVEIILMICQKDWLASVMWKGCKSVKQYKCELTFNKIMRPFYQLTHKCKYDESIGFVFGSFLSEKRFNWHFFACWGLEI